MQISNDVQISVLKKWPLWLVLWRRVNIECLTIQNEYTYICPSIYNDTENREIVPDLDAGAFVSYMTLCCMCSFLYLLSYALSAIKSRDVLFLIQSSARALWLSLISGVKLSGLSLSLSWSVLETEAGRLFPPRSGLPLIAWTMLPFTRGTKLGGTPLVLRGFGLCRLSSGGSSRFENPFGTGMPFACRAVWYSGTSLSGRSEDNG